MSTRSDGEPLLGIHVGRSALAGWPGFPTGNLVGLTLLAAHLESVLRFDGLLASEGVGSTGTLDDGLILARVNDAGRAAAVAESILREAGALLVGAEIAVLTPSGVWRAVHPEARPGAEPFDRHLTEAALAHYRQITAALMAEGTRRVAANKAALKNARPKLPPT